MKGQLQRTIPHRQRIGEQLVDDQHRYLPADKHDLRASGGIEAEHSVHSCKLGNHAFLDADAERPAPLELRALLATAAPNVRR